MLFSFNWYTPLILIYIRFLSTHCQNPVYFWILTHYPFPNYSLHPTSVTPVESLLLWLGLLQLPVSAPHLRNCYYSFPAAAAVLLKI